MALHKSLCFFMFLVTLISCTHARTFEVGGKNGWTTSPSENYNSWAGRLRFLINDVLHFKYDGGVDSVLVVNKGDYDGCNVNNPITKLEGGDSTFKLDRAGPFYFISGNKSSCDQGEKMTVVVITPKNRSPPPGAATPPSSAATPPSPATTPPSPTATPPSSTATPPSSTATPPSSTTTPPSPPAVSPTLPPSPSTMSPVSPPESSISSPPGGAPTSTPAGDAPAMTPSASSPGGGGAAGGPGGAAEGPGGAAEGPGGAAAGGPGGAPGQSPGSNPSDTNSPSVATRPLSATIMASFVFMAFGLWLIN